MIKQKNWTMKKYWFLLLIAIQPFCADATEIHVSTQGDDKNRGTKEKPLRTIQAAVNLLKAGDVCIVHNGIYRETITIGTSGESNAPISIKAAKGEHPIVSGLDILDLNWKATDKKGMFVADCSNTNLEQIFMDGKPLVEARWPNLPKDSKGDWDFFSPHLWATVDSVGNRYGTIKDKDLAATGWDVTGARAILSVCHQFFTWTRKVEQHTAGSDSFSYPKDLGKSIKPADETGGGLKFNDDRYYLVGKKAFLDAPGEWVYDEANHQLYLITPDGKAPKTGSLEKKSRYFGLVSNQDKSNILVDGLTFFGTAFNFGKDARHKSSFIVFTNNQVYYSSWTEYFMMPDGDPNGSLDNNCPTINSDNATISNNVFSYGSLSGLYVNGQNNLIENNQFNDFDLCSSLKYPPLVVSKNIQTNKGLAGNAVVRYNTVFNSGGILSQIGQNDNNVYLNDFHDAFKACFGGNKDVSALYTQSIFCVGTRMHHNWVHEAYCGTPPYEWNGGIGIRGDDNTAGLTLDHNVVWNVGSVGIMVKSPLNPTPEQANRVYNNTVFNHSSFNAIKSAMIINMDHQSKKENAASLTDNFPNALSSVSNNLAESIYGGWFAAPLKPIADFTNNSIGKVTESLLEQKDNFDFRPKATAIDVINKGKEVAGITNSFIGSAPDIGAYEYGDSVYWIPGRREVKASFPIVADGATIATERDVLMWKPAFQAIGHNLYFGTDKDNLKLKGGFLGENNVFKLPKLIAGKKYYWRVDAVMKDIKTVIKGEVWSFSTN